MLPCAPTASAGPPPATAVFDWSGFYAGLNAGVGGGTVWPRYDLVSPPIGFIGSQSVDQQKHQLGGFFAGAQAGYNYQFGNGVVLGAETDFQWSNIGARRRDQTATVLNAGTILESAGLESNEMRITQNWFGTTRLRVGYAFPDRLLTYVTGGVAYSEFSASNSDNGVAFTPPPAMTFSQTSGANNATRIGWTAGAGLEYALDSHLSLKSEYLYSQYSGLAAPFLNVSASTPAVTSGTFSTGTIGLHLVRAGLNYRFGEVAGARETMASVPPTAFRPSWTGFYLGINGGYGGGIFRPARSEVTLDQIPAVPPFTTLNTANIGETLRSGGFLFGGQLGYSHGFANGVVAGIETDLQWSGIGAINRSNIVGLYNQPIGTGFLQNSQLTIHQDWFGTTRLRLGYQAFDRGQIYLTGGIAYSHFSAGIAGASADPAFFFQSTTAGSGSSTRFGWAAGAGVEHALAQNLSFKTEYLYSEYSGFSVPYRGSTIAGNSFGPPAVISTQGTLSSGTLGLHLLRAGLNWKLGDPGH